MTAKQEDILQFSDKLSEALKVKVSKLKKSYSYIQWHTPNFMIMMATRLLSDGWLHFEWRTFLEAYPKPPNKTGVIGNTGLIAAYEAAEYIPAGIGWEYHREGTKTVNLPSEGYRNIILDEIKRQQAIKSIFVFKDGDIHYEGIDDLINELLDEPIESRFDILDL